MSEQDGYALPSVWIGPIDRGDGVDLVGEHTDKQARRAQSEVDDWANSVLAEEASKDAAAAASASSGDAESERGIADLVSGKQPEPTAAEERARQMDFYNQAKANFEAARADIEAGKLRTYPDWASAEAALAKLHPDNQESTWQKFVRNVSPLEAAGGVLDYADNAFETIRLISEKGNEAMMGAGIPAITFGEDGVGLTTDPAELAKTKDIGDALPDIGDPNTHGFARSAGKFMAGYATAGKLLGGVSKLKEVAASGRLGASAVAALKGAMSDFTGMRDLEGSLANLVQEFPTLANPVTEYLSASEESPELVNKLKTAIVGAGFGMAVDGIFAGLRAIRGGRAVEEGAKKVDELAAGLQREADTGRALITESLGDPDAPLLMSAGDAAEQSAGTAGGKTASGATNPRMNGGSRVGDVFVNWARIDSDDDVKQIIQDLANRFSDSIDEARGGVKSFADTEAEAATEDAWKLLTERQQGQPLNAAQTLAVRKLWTSSGAKVQSLARMYSVTHSATDAIALKKMIAVHATIQEQVIGIRTETARALSQWRIPAGESDQFLSGLHGLTSQMDVAFDVDQIARGINRLSDMGNSGAVDQFILGASKVDALKKTGVNTADAIRQLFYMSLLSGPKTHVRNSVSNTAMLLGDAMSRRGAAYLGDLLGGQNVPDGEAAALLYGQMNGALDAFRISPMAKAAIEADGLEAASSPVWNALKTGASGMGVGKLEQPRVGAFEAAKWGVDPKSNSGRVMDWVDTATRLPTNALAAEDEIFRTAAYQGEIHALSFRQATNEAASGLIEDGAVAARAAELARDPSTGLRLMAMAHAERTIFANRPPWDSKLYQFIRSTARLPVIGKLAMAFSKTPYNIAIESAQWSLMAPATSRFRQEIMAGGARADIAWTKFLVGNTALIGLADLAIKGGLVGADRGLGGNDETAGETETARLAGRRPMTMRKENADGTVTSVGFRGLEPISTHIGMAANLVEILSSDQFDSDDKEIDDLVLAAAAAIATQVTQPSFMTGLSDALAFQSDPTRNVETFSERTAGILVPNALAEVARIQDPVLRDVSGWIDAIKAKTPGLSKTLPANTDRWGRDLTRDSGIGWAYDAFVPFEVKRMKPEAIDLELDRLEVGLAKPQKNQFIDGVKVNMKLHPHEYTRFVKLAGNDLKATVEGEPVTVPTIGYESEGGGLMDELNAIVEGRHAFSEIYFDADSTDGPDGDKAAFIGAIVNAYRAEAKVALLKEYPALRAKVLLRANAVPERGFSSERRRDALDRSQ